MQDVAIEVQNVRKVYEIYAQPQDRLKQLLLGRWRSYHKDFHALKGISFSVRKGQCVGIIGRNGAGKSTLLQILTGTMQPSAGHIQLTGRVAAVLELGSGFNPEFSGRQNAMMYGSLYGLTASEMAARMPLIETFAGIGEFIDRPVKTYSSGMQARLAFSVIAHVDADVLIIDEALSVGDAAFTQKCMRFLREFKTRGSILFVSHDMGAVTAFCDEALWIEGGELRFRGSAKETCERYYGFMQTGTEIEQSSINSSAESTHNETNKMQIGAIEERVQSPSASNYSSPALPDNTTPLHTVQVFSDNESLTPGAQRIESFGFNQDSKRHGNGHARILNVQFVSPTGEMLDVCKGGQEVRIRAQAQALVDVAMPIMGFIIKDRLGQPLIGGNTYHNYKDKPVAARPGEFWDVEFGFRLPILAIGNYSITAAIAEGTLVEHEHMDWVHDAVLFEVIETSIDGVIVGAPLDLIHMRNYAQNSA
jgi:lipopolysaccharide transport system ATP-binding protein